MRTVFLEAAALGLLRFVFNDFRPPPFNSFRTHTALHPSKDDCALTCPVTPHLPGACQFVTANSYIQGSFGPSNA